MTLGKGLGGGFPLSAMLTKEPFNLFEPGDQGGTYSGQPLAMAVGHAIVREVLCRNLPLNAEIQGKDMVERLNRIADKYGLSRIRGMGLLLAFDLPTDKGAELVSECLNEGLLINSPHPRTIRLMPPLIVSNQEIDLMFNILTGVMDKMLS